MLTDVQVLFVHDVIQLARFCKMLHHADDRGDHLVGKVVAGAADVGREDHIVQVGKGVLGQVLVFDAIQPRRRRGDPRATALAHAAGRSWSPISSVCLLQKGGPLPEPETGLLSDTGT